MVEFTKEEADILKRAMLDWVRGSVDAFRKYNIKAHETLKLFSEIGMKLEKISPSKEEKETI